MHQKHPPAKVAFSSPATAPSAADAIGIAAMESIIVTIAVARKIRVREIIHLLSDFCDAIDEPNPAHEFLKGVLLRDRFASAFPFGQCLELLSDLFGAEFRH